MIYIYPFFKFNFLSSKVEIYIHTRFLATYNHNSTQPSNILNQPLATRILLTMFISQSPLPGYILSPKYLTCSWLFINFDILLAMQISFLDYYIVCISSICFSQINNLDVTSHQSPIHSLRISMSWHQCQRHRIRSALYEIFKE